MNIVVIQTGFIGDVILSTPVFTELKSYFPGSRLTLLTTPAAAPLMRDHPMLDDTLVFDKRGADKGLSGTLRMARRLRALKFDSVFSLHKSFKTALLVARSGAKQRYGFEEAACSFVYSVRSSRKEYLHEVQRNLAILKPLGLRPESSATRMTLDFSAEIAAEAERLVGDLRSDFVVLAPGSVWATKRWTAEGFASVADALQLQGYSVVLLGGPDDVPVGEAVSALMKRRDRVRNLTGVCTIAVSAQVLSRARLVVTNDSSPLHMASALGVPVVAVFCATLPELGFGPWQVPAEAVGVEGLECRPCGRHGGTRCPTRTHACQLKLDASTVLSAAERLLEDAEFVGKQRGRT